MRLIFRDLTLPHVLRKCGADPVTFLAAGAAMDLFGTGVSALASSSNVNKQLSAQSEENALNRDWQTAEAEKNRVFQNLQYDKAFAYSKALNRQNQEYNLQSMAQQAEYNSPVYQSQQLREAGLHPAVYFGSNSSFGGSSAVSGGSVSPGSPPSGSMPGSVQGLSPVGYQPPNLQIGQILRDVAEARKTMSETKSEDLMRDPLYKEVVAKLKNQQLLNEYQEISNFVFSNVKDARVRKEFVDLSRAEASLVLANDEHELNVAEQKYKSALTRLQDSLSSLHGAEGMLLGLKIKNFDKSLQSELATQASERQRNIAQANESNANALVLKEEKRIRSIAANIKDKTQVDELNSIVHGLRAGGAISQEKEANAVKELAKINKILSSYDNSDSKLKVDAVLDNFFKIIGLNVSASVHN